MSKKNVRGFGGVMGKEMKRLYKLGMTPNEIALALGYVNDDEYELERVVKTLKPLMN